MAKSFAVISRRVLMAGLGVAAFAATPAHAQNDPIRVGFPIVMSGAGAQFGLPVLTGAQMHADEVNRAGGVLGRKIEIIPRDTKLRPDEAVRVARELIVRERVHFLVGTFSSAEAPAVSEIAKENKTFFIAPVAATDRLTAPDALHPYVFRVAKNTTNEGRSAAEIVAKWPIKRIATIGPDYAYGQDTIASFVAHLRKLRPDVEIVDQQWPKLNEPDYTPFLTAQMARKPDAVVSALCCGNFDTLAKQAKPLGYFEAIGHRMLALGEAGSVETTKSLGKDYPFGIWGNAYDAFYWEAGPAHRAYTERLRTFSKDAEPSSWPVQGYIAMQFLVEAVRKAGTTNSEKVSAALKDLTVAAPHGPLTMRAKDQQANRGQVYGVASKDERYPFAVLNPIQYVDPVKFMD
ncbi:MAG TPA: ABC transporter substrate-binding protein [Azospirillum sp.]|nr:ABC transporter substrate-binding protein [Azospirillum sp.]